MRLMILSFMFILPALLVGCMGGQTVGGGVNPIQKNIDDFYDVLIISQTPISAHTGMGDSFHLLGFSWREDNPDNVTLTAVVNGYRSIEKLEFRIDGAFVTARTVEHSVMERRRSSRRFEVSLADFERIARADDVRMRVGGSTGYTVSKFGAEHTTLGRPLAGPRSGEFIKAVNEAISSGER